VPSICLSLPLFHCRVLRAMLTPAFIDSHIRPPRRQLREISVRMFPSTACDEISASRHPGVVQPSPLLAAPGDRQLGRVAQWVRFQFRIWGCLSLSRAFPHSAIRNTGSVRRSTACHCHLPALDGVSTASKACAVLARDTCLLSSRCLPSLFFDVLVAASRRRISPRVAWGPSDPLDGKRFP
jgi:hypothetical protein